MQKIKLTTDQNVPIEVELATVGQRLVAVLLDMVILIAYFLIMLFVLSMTIMSSYSFFDESAYDAWTILFMLLIYLPFALYTPLLEYFFKGQTIGKMALGIRVTKVNGENAAFKNYFTRWLFRPLEMYILLVAVGGVLGFVASLFFDILMASISSRNQRIGDFMAGTIVVRKKPNRVYTINDVLSIRTHKDYQPTYTEITMYTDEDMMLVKNTIARIEKYRNKKTKEFAITLADRIATDLNLEKTPEKRLPFLKTVLNDYIVLTR